MASKEFVHANVLSETHGIVQKASEHLGMEINQVYDKAVKEYVQRQSVPIEFAEEQHGKK